MMSDALPDTLPSPPPASPTSPPQKPKMKLNRITYDGRLGMLYKIWILNFIMKIITLGIYSFWGKTRLRKYVASCFKLGGDRFEYTGTGKELFKGFLKALPVILILYAPLAITQAMHSPLAALFILPFIYVIPMAIFMALRYRLSRTTWRGIRGTLTGSPFKYANFCLKRWFFNAISLGILVPYSDIAKFKFIIDQAYFGNVKAEFKGSARKLMKTHIVTLLLAIPTVGMSRFWYRAALQRQKMAGMVVGDLRFKSDVTAWNMMGIIFGNLLIVLLTLTLGMPIAMNRNLKFLSKHMIVGGDLDTSKIIQGKDQKIAIGEGLDDFMGLDGGFLG